MKIKKVKIGIKSVKEVLADFVKTGEAIAKGEKVKKKKGTYKKIRLSFAGRFFVV